jgi:hypothetical protein
MRDQSAKIITLNASDTEDAVSLSFERAHGDRYQFNATCGQWHF